jgi:hypothetical protein
MSICRPDVILTLGGVRAIATAEHVQVMAADTDG